jgi:regulator of replication initiation timing
VASPYDIAQEFIGKLAQDVDGLKRELETERREFARVCAERDQLRNRLDEVELVVQEWRTWGTRTMKSLGGGA